MSSSIEGNISRSCSFEFFKVAVTSILRTNMNRLLVLLLSVLLRVCFSAHEYNEGDQLGYKCTRVANCSAQVLFLAKQGQFLDQIASQFQSSLQRIQAANNNSLSSLFTRSQYLLIPLRCSCDSSTNRSSSLVSYTVQKGDTYFRIATESFQRLVTYHAIDASNRGLDFTNLSIGYRIRVPVRCGCSETGRLLVTYALGKSYSSASAVSASVGVNETEVVEENNLQDVTYKLGKGTTLLLPVREGSRIILPPPPDGTDGGNKSPEEANATGDEDRWKFYLGISCGALGVVILLCTTALVLVMRRRSPSSGVSSVKFSHTPRNFFLSPKTTSNSSLKNQSARSKFNMSDLMDVDKPIWYSVEEIHKATGSFDSSHRIRDTSVYAAVLRGVKVGIKKCCSDSSSIAQVLRRVHHANLITLLGACHDPESNQTFLVYEYADNGSLDFCIQTLKLDWKMRLRIALDVATGLEYLHDYAKPGFVHRNITSSNVLLDANFQAKIANFHTARASTVVGEESSSKTFVGSLGYMAPEYFLHGTVSAKMDVYAFGVVLLELVTGQKPVVKLESTRKGRLFEEFFLSELLCAAMDSSSIRSSPATVRGGQLVKWIDSTLKREAGFSVESAIAVALLARSCLQNDPKLRPTMRDVACTLMKLMI